MKPDFDELVGDEGSRDELHELRQVHDLLVSASPPPSLDHPTPTQRIRRLIPRWWGIGALAFATTASVMVGLVAGYTLERSSGHHPGFTRPMHGVGQAATASALINIGEEDANGNRPLHMMVQALPALSEGRWYELYLTRKGKPVVPCGIFQTGRSGSAQFTMNAPADLAEYDGWIVTTRVPGHPARVLLTT